ncbi:MAG TPA: sodium:solute symporter [Cytophagaceae bacterium]|nr:sodium:solute symporter [Cytophagaceae bacterium]
MADRSIPWFVIGAALFATDLSGEHFLGLANEGFSSGLAVSNFVLSACVVLMLLGWLFTPFYLKTGVFTMPQFLEKRYNEQCRWYLSTISITAFILTKVSATLLAGGIVLKHVMGWDIYTSALVLVLTAGLYTLLGGSRGIIMVQVVQAFFIILGSAILVYYGLEEVGGWEALKTKVPVDYFKIFKPMDHPDFPWTGMVFGALILGIWYWTTDQYIVQITLSARNIDHARSGTLFAGYLRLLPILLLVVPGIIAKALYPEIPASSAYITLVTNLLPSGIRAIVIISLLAALMTSLSSSFNATSTLFTMDIYNKLYPKANDFVLVNIGRIATFVVVVFGIIWVPFIYALSNDIYFYIQSVQSYIAPPICVVFLVGIFWARANGTAAFSVLIIGFILGMIKFVSDILYRSFNVRGGIVSFLGEINFLHFAIFLFLFSVLLIIVISLQTNPPEEKKVKGFTLKYANEIVKDEDYKRESGKYKKLNMVATVVLVLILFLYWFVFG